MFTVAELIHMLRYSTKKRDVLVMLSLLLLKYKAEGINSDDNESQFIANAVREYLKEKDVYQEFSHVATLKNNAYTEALHSILQREVIERFEFESFHHAQLVINRYYERNNQKRRHGSLGSKTPKIIRKKYNPIPFENEKLLNYL